MRRSPSVPLGGSKPLPDQFDILLGCRHPLFDFFLEGVKDIDWVGKFHRVDGPVGVGVMPVDDLHDGGSAKALQGLGRPVGCALLRRVQSLAYVPAHLLREGFSRSARLEPIQTIGLTSRSTIQVYVFSYGLAISGRGRSAEDQLLKPATLQRSTWRGWAVCGGAA